MNKSLFHCLASIRLPVIIALNLLLTSVSYIASISLRFDFNLAKLNAISDIALPLALLLLFRFVAYIYFGLHSAHWRYFSVPDLIAISKAHLASSVALTTSVMMLRIPGFPRSVVLIELCLSILLIGGSRLTVRLLREKFLRSMFLRESGQNNHAIIIGGGDSGNLLIKNLKSLAKAQYSPVAVLDDSERLQKTNIHGVKVLGPLSMLASILENTPTIGIVLVAIPSLSESRYKEIYATCEQFNVPVKSLLSFEAIACHSGEVQHESISIESLLEKEITVEHEEEIRHALFNKRILVTGAGGSIGSELVMQIVNFSPKTIIALDNSEFNLFRVNRELLKLNLPFPIEIVLANICDKGRLFSIFQQFEPDIIFHAAAYKHVPIMESNCYEAFSNNIIGTRNVLEATHAFGGQQFVMISTDKAVDPSNIMGCSKRIAELLMQDFSKNRCSNGNGNGLRTAAVRFGNVINSTGSVIPLFKEQILRGEPLTVTHPEMTRYFMSTREAVRLVLTAGILGNSGEVYILEMGEPIRILDVAKKMCALYGRRDLPIIFTGLRPGEKLSETLTFKHEALDSTGFPKIHCVKNLLARNVDTLAWIDEIEETIKGLNEAQIGHLIREFVFNSERDFQIGERPQVGNIRFS